MSDDMRERMNERCRIRIEGHTVWVEQESALDLIAEAVDKAREEGRAEVRERVEKAVGAHSFGQGRPEWKTEHHNGAHDVIRVDQLRAALRGGSDD